MDLLLLWLVVLTALSDSSASDHSQLVDFCVADPNSLVMVNGLLCKDPKLVQAKDFFFTGFHLPGNTTNALGLGLTRVSVAEIPGLNTLDISLGRIDFAPKGITLPHFHPRASEILLLLEGSMEVGFVTSNPENRLFTKVLVKGEVFVFPEGLVHFQRNVGNGNAVSISRFSSSNSRIVFIPNSVFGSNPAIPNDVLAKAFRADKDIINQIASKF